MFGKKEKVHCEITGAEGDWLKVECKDKTTYYCKYEPVSGGISGTHLEKPALRCVSDEDVTKNINRK
jgi:hypothetical protein